MDQGALACNQLYRLLKRAAKRAVFLGLSDCPVGVSLTSARQSVSWESPWVNPCFLEHKHKVKGNAPGELLGSSALGSLCSAPTTCSTRYSFRVRLKF
jgi:hypothetical protein